MRHKLCIGQDYIEIELLHGNYIMVAELRLCLLEHILHTNKNIDNNTAIFMAVLLDSYKEKRETV